MQHRPTDLAPQFRRTLEFIRDHGHESGRALPGAFYTDSHWLEFEQSAWFARAWICVGREEEVADNGDYITTRVANEPVIVVRGTDGELRALSNVCRHRGTLIADGGGNTRSFLCPYHNWTYDTAGKLMHAPGFAANGPVGDCTLPRFHCRAWCGFVFVCIGEHPPDLEASLAGLWQRIGNYHLEEMKLHILVEERWPVNWKSLVENFMEGYHLSPLHRGTLHQLNPSHLCRHFERGENWFGYEVGFTSRLSPRHTGHPDLNEDERNTCVMFAVPPGLVVGVGGDYSSFLCIRPRAADGVHIRMGLIFHGDGWRDDEIKQATRLFHDTMAEDKAVLLRVQQGMASCLYRPGPLAPADLEGTLWDFQRIMAERLLPALDEARE